MSTSEVYYCNVYDVAQIMGLDIGRFGDETRPAKETVDMLIKMVMDYVDRYCRTAWRERKSSEVEGERNFEPSGAGYEYHWVVPTTFTGFMWLGRPVFLRFYPVRPFDATKGDSVQVFTGQGWEEWVGVRPLSETGDWWVDWDRGIIWFRRMFWFSKLQGPTIRARYRYGFLTVPQDIRYATALLTAAHLVESGDYVVLLPEGATNIVYAREKAELWRERAHEILERYKRWTW
ncbi:MAG: hypothetical protein QXN77_08040 [Candidatus Caldarchaeum sp.]